MSLFYYTDFGSGRLSLLAKETEVVDNLVIVGSGSEDLELTDELFREHKLAPPLNIEGIHKKYIGVLGAKPIPSTFQVPETINSGEEGQANMVTLNLTMLKRSGARSGSTSSATPSPSSHDGRSKHSQLRPRPQQT